MRDILPGYEKRSFVITGAYRLISTQDLQVAHDVIFLLLLEASAAESTEKDISVGRTLGCLGYEVL